SFLGDGTGGFAAGVPSYDLPSGAINPEILDVEAQDVDGDGIPDLVLMAGYSQDYPSRGYWGTGHGDGKFEIPYYFGSASGYLVDPLLKPRDLNGDGFIDFLLSPTFSPWNPSLVSTTFLGALEADHRFTVYSECCQRSGGFVDLDGDSFLDLLGIASVDSLRFGSGAGTGQFLRSGPDFSPSAFPFYSLFYGPDEKNSTPLQADFDEDGLLDIVTLDGLRHVRVLFNRANRVASDQAESLAETAAGARQLDPEIDLVEVQGRVGAYDFAGTGIPQGALVLTMAINQFTELESSQDESGGGLVERRDGSEPARPFGNPGRLHPPNGVAPGLEGPHASLKSGTFQLFLNFGEPLVDSDGDGHADLSLANARQEPGLSGIPLADLTLNLRLDTKGPAFTGMHDINRFSTVDRDRGVATFVIPFEQMVSLLTPAERASMDLGDGTGHLFLWAVSRLYGDRDRIPDTNDGADPTIHSEVREFRFPLTDLHATPFLDFGDVRIGKHVDGPLTVSNRGVRPVEFNSLELPDPMLAASMSTPFSVPAVEQLQLPLRFAPTAHASFDGNMNLGTSALQQPLSILMTGRGVAPILRVTPSSLNFSPTAVGFTSEDQQVTVSNVGDDWLEGSWELEDALHQFGMGPYYFPEDTYPFDLYPGESFHFNLTFTAAHEGRAIGNLKILSDDDLLPRVDVSLTALGTPPEPRIAVASYATGDPIVGVPIGGEGSADFQVYNPGSATLEIFGVTSSNPHFTTSMDRTSIPPKESGHLMVTYHPVAWGLETTTLTLSHNDPTHPPVTRTLGGRAFEPPPVAQVTPTTLDFGSLHQGASATLSFEVKNLGNGPLRLTGYSPFLQPYCTAQTDLILPATLLPGETLTASVTFTADIDKSYCSSFYFFTNDPNLSQVSIQILATILSPRISLSSYYLPFPNTPIGSSSTGSLTAFNLGPGPLIISNAFGYNISFSLSTPLPLTITPGGNAELEFVFSPVDFNGTGGSITLYTNDLNYRQVYVSLYGYGLPPTSLRSKQLAH
ncbi:MAG: choice-of-anchor D domain-containing protein, partial [Acidobacteria bacterium]|nr:choice-of-anchor D domain-containing protein [Acidobacteriota bacterium]